MAKKQKDKTTKKEIKTKEEIPQENFTLDEVEKEQQEIELLKDTVEIEPKDLTEEQKEILRKNVDKLPDEQKEYYKEVLESSEDLEEEQADPSKEKLKKKLSASARENQKIYAKNRVINQALVEAEDIPEPTKKELKQEFPDWDVMSEVEKRFAKEAVVSKRWRAVIQNAKEQATKIEKWNESVNNFIGNPKTLNENPDLEGKAEEFREFALTEANNSVPFNILVSAFLHEHSSGRSPNKGRMFETGSGGPNTKPIPNDGKISIEEAAQIKKTNYNKYKELLVEGKIKDEF